MFPSFYSPIIIISPSAKIGYGTVVMPKAVINAGSKIGIHTIINTNAIVEHDNQIGDYVHISCAVLAGGVKVGNLSHIALNATVLPLVEIGSHCVVGAGATVIKMLNQNQQSLVRQQNTRSEKLKEERIYLSRPHMGGSEQNIFKMLLRKLDCPLGENVTEFENSVKAYTSSEAALAVGSGTSAIHLALIEAGVERDDIVFCSS